MEPNEAPTKYGIFAGDGKRYDGPSWPTLAATFDTAVAAWGAVLAHMGGDMSDSHWQVLPLDVAQPEAPADSTQGWVDSPAVAAVKAGVASLAADPLDYLLRQWRRNDGHTLPHDSAERKCIPLRGGCYAYIPAALAAFAAWSQINNQKHNPGQPLHWSQANSADHEECIARHDFDAAEARDAKAKLVELTARFWRAGAELQMFAQAQGAPKAPGAK